MIRLSVPFRQALSRLTLPVMLMLSLGIVLFGRADQNLGDRLRAGLDDLLAPAYAVVAGPVEALEHGTGAIGNLFNLASQNAQLRDENAKLLQWQSVAMALEAQDDAPEKRLEFRPPANPGILYRPRGGRSRRRLCPLGAGLDLARERGHGHRHGRRYRHGRAGHCGPGG